MKLGIIIELTDTDIKLATKLSHYFFRTSVENCLYTLHTTLTCWSPQDVFLHQLRVQRTEIFQKALIKQQVIQICHMNFSQYETMQIENNETGYKNKI